MAKKKYQVFVSSTFSDLKDERQAVNRAILNLGHIPAGMELFPASDTDQMSFIRRVIDDCDYYLLIIGGRYGSTSDEGLSYTELEYNYAVDQKKPVLAFLHADASDLKARNVELDSEKLARLGQFRARVQTGRLIEFWSSIENLESRALISLTAAFNDMPQLGWRRDSGELSEAAQRQMESIRSRYDQIRDRYEDARKRASDAEWKLNEYESLEGAEVEVRYSSKETGPVSITIQAEQIIREFAAALSAGLDDREIELGLAELVRHKFESNVEEINDVSVKNIALFFEVFEIASRSPNGLITIREDKVWLLKAAFKPLKKVILDHQDDIPF